MSPDNHWTFMTPEEENWAEFVANTGDTAPPTTNTSIKKTSARPAVFAMSTPRGARKRDEVSFAVRKDADNFARDFLNMLGIRHPDTSGMRRQERQESHQRYLEQIDAIKVLVISFTEYRIKKTVGFEGLQPLSRQLRRQLNTKLFNARGEFAGPIVEALKAIGIPPTGVLQTLTFKELLAHTERVRTHRFVHTTFINEMNLLDHLDELESVDEPLPSMLAFIPAGDDESIELNSEPADQITSVTVAFQRLVPELQSRLNEREEPNFEFCVESTDELCECGYHVRTVEQEEKIGTAFARNCLPETLVKLTVN
jgi:hypothetical protein